MFHYLFGHLGNSNGRELLALPRDRGTPNARSGHHRRQNERRSKRAPHLITGTSFFYETMSALRNRLPRRAKSATAATLPRCFVIRILFSSSRSYPSRRPRHSCDSCPFPPPATASGTSLSWFLIGLDQSETNSPSQFALLVSFVGFSGANENFDEVERRTLPVPLRSLLDSGDSQRLCGSCAPRRCSRATRKPWLPSRPRKPRPSTSKKSTANASVPAQRFVPSKLGYIRLFTSAYNL